MREITPIRHGEVILVPIDSLPENAVLECEQNDVVVAHSETGHHHVLTTKDMSKIKVFSHNGEKYVEVPSIAELWHQKTGNEVHKTHTVKPSIYKINLKKEFDYFAGVLREVRD